MRRRCLFAVLACPVIAMGLALAASNVKGNDAPSSDEVQAYQQAIDRAAGYLKTKAQGPDGGYAAYAGPGVTAVITTGLLHNGRSPNDPVVAKSLAYLAGFAQPDADLSERSLPQLVLPGRAVPHGGQSRWRYDKLLKERREIPPGRAVGRGLGKASTIPITAARLRQAPAARLVEHAVPRRRPVARQWTGG